jgi:hypothetical protein
VKEIDTLNILFQGVDYIIDIIKQDGDTTMFVEIADSDEEIEETVLLKLTSYLIGEGFIES